MRYPPRKRARGLLWTESRLIEYSIERLVEGSEERASEEQTQNTVTSEREVAPDQASNGINGGDPPEVGRKPFMPDWSLIWSHEARVSENFVCGSQREIKDGSDQEEGARRARPGRQEAGDRSGDP